MNDFTKEELEDIMNWADVYTEFGNAWSYKQYKPLIDKLQLMIDNYCEHESDGVVWKGNSDNDMPDEFRCKKCFKFYL